MADASPQVYRIAYADVLRIVATIAVVVIHASVTLLWPVKDVANWHIGNFLTSSCYWAVGVFVMLSGMLHLTRPTEPKFSLEIKKMLKRAAHIFVVLFVWGIFYQNEDRIFVQHELPSMETIGTQIKELLFVNTPHYHLWFLYAIAGLYIISPFMHVALNSCKREHIEWFLLFVLLFEMYPFLRILIFPELFYKPFWLFPPSELCGYAGYYLAGFYFAKFGITRNRKKVLMLFGLLGAFLAILLNCYMIKRCGALIFVLRAVQSNVMPHIMLGTAGVFLAIKTLCERIQFSPAALKVLSRTSKLTFGVYLVHVFIISSLRRCEINVIHWNSPLGVLIVIIPTLLVAFAFTFVASKIPLARKLVS